MIGPRPDEIEIAAGDCQVHRAGPHIAGGWHDAFPLLPFGRSSARGARQFHIHRVETFFAFLDFEDHIVILRDAFGARSDDGIRILASSRRHQLALSLPIVITLFGKEPTIAVLVGVQRTAATDRPRDGEHRLGVALGLGLLAAGRYGRSEVVDWEALAIN